VSPLLSGFDTEAYEVEKPIWPKFHIHSEFFRFDFHKDKGALRTDVREKHAQ
jgi:hypothetical protein